MWWKEDLIFALISFRRSVGPAKHRCNSMRLSCDIFALNCDILGSSSIEVYTIATVFLGTSGALDEQVRQTRFQGNPREFSLNMNSKDQLK